MNGLQIELQRTGWNWDQRLIKARMIRNQFRRYLVFLGCSRFTPKNGSTYSTGRMASQTYVPVSCCKPWHGEWDIPSGSWFQLLSRNRFTSLLRLIDWLFIYPEMTKEFLDQTSSWEAKQFFCDLVCIYVYICRECLFFLPGSSCTYHRQNTFKCKIRLRVTCKIIYTIESAHLFYYIGIRSLYKKNLNQMTRNMIYVPVGQAVL
jgi:hypothetical protein